MADITRVPLLRHLRGSATTYVVHLRRGTIAHEGTGSSFWFRPLSAAISEVPVDDRELALMFHARTADYQDVTVQASVTFRIDAPGRASTRVDFSIDPDTGAWRAAPLDQLGGLLTEIAQQHAMDLLARLALPEVLVRGVTAVRERVTDGLAAEPRLAETGIVILGVRVVAIRPQPEVEKALQTPSREQVQQEADRATYERRALAVQRERAIAENELQNQIELARREEQLVAQRGANGRLTAEEAAAADSIEAEAQALRKERLANATAHARRVVGEAEAAAETARVAAYQGVPEGTLLALAAQQLAGNLPQIQSLVLTPDLIAPLLARLGTGSAVAGEQR